MKPFATKFAVSPHTSRSYLKTNLLMWASHAVKNLQLHSKEFQNWRPSWISVLPGHYTLGYHRHYKEQNSILYPSHLLNSFWLIATKNSHTMLILHLRPDDWTFCSTPKFMLALFFSKPRQKIPTRKPPVSSTLSKSRQLLTFMILHEIQGVLHLHRNSNYF